METHIATLDGMAHVRTIIGMILGLSVARIINGLARFVQHPGTIKVYPVHLGWVIFLLIAIVHFWWYEFHLALVSQWTFPIYVFVIVYTGSFVALAAMLFPDQMNDYKGFEDYFESRKTWFFAILILSFLLDIGDTMIKGQAYFKALGIEYLFRQAGFIIASLIAITLKSRRYHLAFVSLAIIYQISWIMRVYDVLQ
jgi:hypothetical protein